MSAPILSKERSTFREKEGVDVAKGEKDEGEQREE